MAKVAVISACAVFMVAIVIAIAVTVGRHNQNGKTDGEVSTTSKVVLDICQPTDYNQTCVKSLSSANTTDPRELIKIGFLATITEIQQVVANSKTLKELVKDPKASQALEICDEVMGRSVDDLNKSVNEIGEYDLTKLEQYIDNMKVWLSAAVTYQQTCLDGFVNTTGEAGEKMEVFLKTSKELTSNALAMVSQISSVTKNLGIEDMSQTSSTQRKLLSQGNSPSWVQRVLLQASATALKPNVVVAQDGSGKYRTIKEVLKEVPVDSPEKFVIYVKAGVYKEQVLIGKGMNNVVFIGDGPLKTKITGSLNYVDGISPFNTATVAIVGDRFMAKDIGFENSAGAIKRQAVALRVEGDQSIFYNCQIDGYQSTLLALSHRQYYRNCTITGTVDFVFGDSVAVFQDCKMIVRKPVEENQDCIVTAQGRKEIRQVTGFVIQNCVISGVKGKNKAYLGRPSQEFSRTIIMQSQIDDIIDPEGWTEFNGNFGVDTLWYAELGNRGAGADTKLRVKWKGIQKIDAAKAESFTPSKFMDGDQWIPSSGVPYNPGMFPKA